MRMLSRPIDQLLAHYSVVVVGSGYGGAIAADRIARAGRDVCVLERGKELHPGEYPNSALSALREMQVHTPTADHGAATGMFDFHVGTDITTVVGCGLGGTSLINANVALEPSDSIFSDARWPAPLRDRPEALRPFMQAARDMLGSNPYPRTSPDLPKLQALERVAASLGREISRPDINVTFVGGPNAVGVDQNACVLCGDCCSGCNYGAKNTVLMNYLPDAHAHGAHIFTEVAVQSLRRWQGKWQVAYDLPGEGRKRDGDAPAQFVTADVVVLAAGTLGSTRILLRSREEGLPVSDRLGHGFSGNGDVLAFAYDTDESVRGVGLGRRAPSEDTAVGPAIAGLVDLRDPGTGLENALIIEDGSIPGALAAMLPIVASAASPGNPAFPRSVDKGTASLAGYLRGLAGTPLSAYRGPLDRTLTYLVMSTDDSGGQIVLENDRIQVVWPGVASQPEFAHNNRVLDTATHALRGTVIHNPLWAWTSGRSLITVHPLGGCVMADDAAGGVVDHKGQVFDPVGGGVHEGLYVCDGSVVPLSLDANPLLTIAGLAERTAAIMIEERNWTAGQAAAPSVAPPLAQAVPTARLEFTERLAGFVSMSAHDGYREGYERGRDDGARVELLLTIEYDDVQALLDDPKREARISGTVLAPELSPDRLTVTEGRFTLLDPDPSRENTWYMRYRMSLLSKEGSRYLFEGHKEIRKHGARHAWSETTTLYTRIGEADGPAPGTGLLRLEPADLTSLVRSIKVQGGPPGRQGQYRRAFLELFAGQMMHIYGGVPGKASAFPSAPSKASLVREPKDADGVWWCDSRQQWHAGDRLGDDAFLRLTRYRAGGKGPVMLATGFGMSSRSFLASTIEQNLTEYLAERGYDIWLFDYRAGIDLPSARTEFTIDDIARDDWPIAVRKVLDVTGREDLQAFGHCVGSVSLQMALLSGLPGIRAAVCAQFPMHPATSAFNQVKSRIGVANALDRLGVKVVAPDLRSSTQRELLDTALRALPMPAKERCDQAVCRWINAIYGCTHRHAQLNDATHRALNEMFGSGNIDSLEHLSLMMRKGLAVTSTGGMDYFDHPERIAGTRLMLLQGMQNYIFRPPGTQRTLKWLQSSNPQGDYQRVELPGYAHLDAVVGTRAAIDVYPRIADFLDRE